MQMPGHCIAVAAVISNRREQQLSMNQEVWQDRPSQDVPRITPAAERAAFSISTSEGISKSELARRGQL